jgi:transcriptional regulator with XRE-family HTH domain
MEARGPLVVRRRLGARLKSLREEAGILLEVAATHIECSTSKLSRLEHGQGIPKAIEVSALLELYGVKDADVRERMLDWAARAKATTWWQPYSEAVAGDLELYISLEAEARQIRIFSIGSVIGLLQTARYAEASLKPYTPNNLKRLQTLVEVRLRRQTVLERKEPRPVRLELVLAEEVLYRRVGSPEVMSEQFKKLAAMSQLENVSVAILPMRAARPIAHATFTIFTPSDEADWEVVNEEGNVSDQWFETRRQVDTFRAIWDDLQRRSVPGSDAREIISDVLSSEYGEREENGA